MTEQTDREQALAVVRRTVEDADLEHEGGARCGRRAGPAGGVLRQLLGGPGRRRTRSATDERGRCDEHE